MSPVVSDEQLLAKKRELQTLMAQICNTVLEIQGLGEQETMQRYRALRDEITAMVVARQRHAIAEATA